MALKWGTNLNPLLAGPGAAAFGGSANGVNSVFGRTRGAQPNTNPLPQQTNTGLVSPNPEELKALEEARANRTSYPLPPVAGASAGGLQSETVPQYTVGGAAFPETAPKPDVDISQKGPAEDAFDLTGPEFLKRKATEEFNDTYGAQLMAPDANARLLEERRAAGPMVNNSQGVFEGFKMPDIASEPGYGAYYDNAQKHLTGELTRQLSARGSYGSSAGLGLIGSKVADLRADQARTEADYNLKRQAEQRSWKTLHGELGRNADLSGQGNQEIMSTLASNASTSADAQHRTAQAAANAEDVQKIAGLMGYNTAAAGAQGMQQDRVELGLKGVESFTVKLQTILGDAWQKVQEGDMKMVDAIQSALTAGRANDANYDSSQQGRFLNEALAIYNAGLEPLKAVKDAVPLAAAL